MPEPIVLYEGAKPIPTRWEVCWRCHGEGKHDAWEEGMTASEMAEQGDEFIEDYCAGHYSVPCSQCHGERVLAVPDEDQASPEALEEFYAWKREEAADRQVRRMEMGYRDV